MVTASISFTGKLSLQDMLDIHRYHSRFVIRTSIRQWMAVVSLLIAALIIGAGLHSHFVPFSFFVLALCAYYPFGWFLLDRWSVRSCLKTQRTHLSFRTGSNSTLLRKSAPFATTFCMPQVGLVSLLMTSQ